MSSKGAIFRMFNPAGRKKEDAVEKRREQLRQAQHVYRQRKTRYVKALEGELATSRRRECQMFAEKKRLENDIQMMLHLLSQHGISPPDISLSQDAQATPGRLTQSPTSQDEPLVYIHPEWPQAPKLLPSPPPPPFSIIPSNDNTSMSSRVCEVDQTTLGMTFVLKIEEPCLSHVHGDSTNPDNPSGHALTATSHLLCLSSQPPPKRSSLLPVQDAPAGILDRLLALAPQVTCEAEVTPIQAWDEIRRKPVFGSLDLRCVMSLAERLRDAAKCHGFGAVVDYAVFQKLVGELIAQKISFGFT
ncbi:hypothetical protein VTK56DRAFT_9396 [Thermocarpiscus australiensis]